MTSDAHTKESGLTQMIPLSHMSRLVRKPTMWFPNKSDTNQAVQSQKMARGLKFWI